MSHRRDVRNKKIICNFLRQSKLTKLAAAPSSQQKTADVWGKRMRPKGQIDRQPRILRWAVSGSAADLASLLPSLFPQTKEERGLSRIKWSLVTINHRQTKTKPTSTILPPSPLWDCILSSWDLFVSRRLLLQERGVASSMADGCPFLLPSWFGQLHKCQNAEPESRFAANCHKWTLLVGYSCWTEQVSISRKAGPLNRPPLTGLVKMHEYKTFRYTYCAWRKTGMLS